MLTLVPKLSAMWCFSDYLVDSPTSKENLVIWRILVWLFGVLLALFLRWIV